MAKIIAFNPRNNPLLQVPPFRAVTRDSNLAPFPLIQSPQLRNNEIHLATRPRSMAFTIVLATATKILIHDRKVY